MLVLFTDFGWDGPYVGQVKAVLSRAAPGVPVIDLMHDAPAFNPRAAAYLLAALAPTFPADTVFICVVDPGVGTARRPIVAELDGRWFVAPDNGLLNVLAQRSSEARWWVIDWRPEQLSASFHGRDLFAPVGAMLATRSEFACTPCPAPPIDPASYPEQLAEIIYIDHYGNAMTGLQADSLPSGCTVRAGKQLFSPATTFAEKKPGAALCYRNACGLLELSINQGHAAERAKLTLGSTISVQSPAGNMPGASYADAANPAAANSKRKPGKLYSLGEEIANSIVSGIAAALSVAGLVILIIEAALHGDAWAVVSVSIFGTTLILSHLASTLYHSIAPPRAKRVLQIMDHLAIYLLIAGTYTPFALVSLRGPWGWSLLLIIWTLALLGLVIKLTPLDSVRGLSTGFYVAMGWTAVIAIKPLLDSIAPGGLWWLLAGGLCYTAGVGFYAWRKLKYSHAIWHGFVLAGSACHYFAVLLYVIPPGTG